MLGGLARFASPGLLLLAISCRDPAPAPSAAAPTASALPSVSASATAAPATPWPELPTNAEGARALVSEHTLRPPRAEPPLGVEQLLVGLRSAAERSELVAGLDAIAARLSRRAKDANAKGRTSFVLFGTFHDAPAQIAAFRKLTGPLGYGPTDAALEQLHAPGRWRGVEAGAQIGDEAVLTAEGGRAALDALVASQRDHNHTAWKYDYLEELPALATTLRATGVALRGCDLPSAVQDRVRPLGDAALLDLRELHCALSLAESPRGAASRVAVLWGASHVGADRAQRFLPANADVVEIHVFGGRPAGDGAEAELSRKLRLAEPVLFPVEGRDRFALILAEGALGARVDRARTQPGAGDAEKLGKLVITSESPVELVVSGKRFAAGAQPLPPGAHGYVAVPKSGPLLAGAVPMPEHGFVELDLDAGASSLRLVVHRGR